MDYEYKQKLQSRLLIYVGSKTIIRLLMLMKLGTYALSGALPLLL